MVCHGGQIPNATGTTATAAGVATPVFDDKDPATDDRPNVKLGSKFLPFDLNSFTYAEPDPTGPCNPATAPQFSKCGQQDEFRRLNEIAKIAPPPDLFDPSSDLIEVLFNRWYTGPTTPPALQVENAVVPLWDTDSRRRNFYQSVVAKSCRTCHITSPFPELRFEQPGTVGVGIDGNIGAVQNRVCNEHVMPHARRTHDLFWTSVNPSRPAQLQAYGDSSGLTQWQDVNDPAVSDDLACGQEFTPGGGVLSPPTAFTQAKAVLSTCSGCHYAARAALPLSDPLTVSGLNLDLAVAYSQIVDVNSNELPSFKRVVFGTNTETTSYLWRKISNTHIGLGTYIAPGPGVPMPQGTTGLTSTDPNAANTIRDWIRNGAAP
jgi:hypothetical protein